MEKLGYKIQPQPYSGSMLIVPNDDLPHPGIVILHGSEGGGRPFWKMKAIKWAAEGFSVLAYCYFGAKDGIVGPGETLSNVSIDSLLEAILWFKKSEFVQEKNIALGGGSRGGELTLLAGSLIEDSYLISALFAHSPASTTWGAWNHDWVDEKCWLGDVPPVDQLFDCSNEYIWNKKCGPDPRSISKDNQHSWSWKGSPIETGTRISIENIKNPVFISQGLKDSVWPASQTKEIESDLKKNKIPHQVYYYEKDDHWLSIESTYDRDTKLLSFFKKYLN